MTQPADDRFPDSSALLRQLNAINTSLSTAIKVVAELVIRAANTDGSRLTSTELRSVGLRLVSSGGDLTGLGVEMGTAADQLEDT